MSHSYDPIQVFNDFSASYLPIRENEFNNFSQLDFIAQQLQPLENKRILELGCGGGVPILKYFSDKNAEVWGVDFSEKMLAHAKVKLPNSQLILADICNVPLPANHFDAILSFYTLFVLELKQQYAVFQKIYDALKPGGLSYFTLLGEKATQQREFAGYLAFMDYQFYYAHTTPEQYQAKLTQIGFQDIQIQEKAIGPETCMWVYAKK